MSRENGVWCVYVCIPNSPSPVGRGISSVARVFNNPKDEYDSSTSRVSVRLCIIPGVPIHRYLIGGGLCVYVLLYLDFLQGEECRR